MNKKVIRVEDVDLAKIKPRLEYGDMQEIASKTGYSPIYVQKVLNPKDVRYNSKIIREAIRLIDEKPSIEVSEELAKVLIA